MKDSPFLTDLDSRAAVKGSRDPLGIQPIWTKMGRYLIGNLTTVTTSVRDFTTLLLGYYFAERLASDGGGDGDLAVFLKWEQLAAYARGKINGDWNFRGTERAKKNLNDGISICLSQDPKCQILSNQKMYGLWGLYTVPSRSSGLLEGDPIRLTPKARKFIEKAYLPIFKELGFNNGDLIAQKLAPSKVSLDVKGKDLKILKAVARILQRRILVKERLFYEEYLLLGVHIENNKGLQEILSGAIKSTLNDSDWRMSSDNIRYLAKFVRDKGERGEEVSEKLERIRICEMLMAPAAALFDFLLGSEGQTIAEVAKAVYKQWGKSLKTIDVEATALLEGDLRNATNDNETAKRWLQISQALYEGSYEKAILLLLEQNRFVMKVRSNAAPWIDLQNDNLHVRFLDEQPRPLPEKDDLPEYWRHPYFIESLRSIAKDLQE
ncbi:hypothetical protein JW926_17130 [Candidatus Sumerlaeota bacterium]|nr:hypothetical protein [Candidatus Sumerlaeota bacterium]